MGEHRRRLAGETLIVHTVGEGLQLITQPDHAALAGRIMEQCVSLAKHPRRTSILRATAEHDSAWGDTDAAPTVDPETGTVADFIHVPLSVRQGVWPRSVARLADDAWAAALVAHHAITVYSRFESTAEWKDFFSQMMALRDASLRSTPLALDELDADYAFVRLGDLISLTFCTGSVVTQQFREWTVQLVGTRVVVTPDLFGGATIPLQVSARGLARRSFATDADLREAFGSAPTVPLNGEAAGA